MKHTSQRWFSISIGFGFALGLLMLGNSVANYYWVSQRIVVEQVRKDLSAQAVAVDKLLQNARPSSPAEANEMLEQIRANSNGRIAWIQLRDGHDTALAVAGLDVQPTFSAEVIRSKMRGRQAIFETRSTRSGKVLVEAFPIRVPAQARRSSIQLAAYEPAAAARGAFGVVEIAAYMNGAGALWPLQRNLLLNSSAALALLGALAMMRVRFKAYVSGLHLANQMAHARRVQQDLLPSPRQARGDFSIAGECAPASELNGDFYDVFQVRGNGTAVVLGDVAGKGVPAAMLAGVRQGAVRSSSWAGSGRRHVEATRQLNQLLCERASRERYASMFWGYFAPESGAFRYVNAGHLPPLLFSAATPGAVHRLTSGGPVLGLLNGARYEQGERAMENGDLLVLYSDGILEAANKADEQFGEERVMAVVRDHFAHSAEEIRNAILSAVRAFTGNAAATDDQTLLVIRKTEAGCDTLAETCSPAVRFSA
ncbi:MAG: PP2C family protein-serine/threonine phosphatase [Bryobacterales bacterium]|nr:PP2C family protein-serine/threonine phosphatase [Bryobacterales bacterium]